MDPTKTKRPYTIGELRAWEPKFRRFIDSANPTQKGCHLWTGGWVNKQGGYGWYRRDAERYMAAHRIVWALDHGVVPPPDVAILHRCDEPRCCLSDHLVAGSQLMNIHDMVLKGRHTYGERHPFAKLTAEKVIAARRLHAEGEGVCALARAFGVSLGPMQRALSGKTWRHVVAM